MIHTLEAFDQQTGHRVKRGTVVQTPVAGFELVDIVADDRPHGYLGGFYLVVVRRGEVLQMRVHPSVLGLYVRDLSVPDYSNVRTGLEAIELLQDAIAQLSLTAEVSSLITAEPVEGF